MVARALFDTTNPFSLPPPPSPASPFVVHLRCVPIPIHAGTSYRLFNMGDTSAADCTSATCPVEEGFFSAPPSLEGAAFMLAAFSALIPINLWVGARCRTTTYTLCLVAGLILEILGYVGMLLMRSDLASKTYFVMLLLGTTIGPTFITAAIFTILPHILSLYGSDVSIVPEPIWLSYYFSAFDAFTVAFQAVGSAFAAKGFSRMEVSYPWSRACGWKFIELTEFSCRRCNKGSM